MSADFDPVRQRNFYLTRRFKFHQFTILNMGFTTVNLL